MIDLFWFMIIIIVFILSFGVITQSTMYPKSGFNVLTLKKIIDNAYWTVYGEIKIFDVFEKDCVEDCPDFTGVLFSYFALMIYILITNVLLLNLLIAMFRYINFK